MKALERLSFGRQLAAATLLTSTLALLLAAVILLWQQVRTARQEMEADLRSLAAVVGANSTGALAFGDARAARENLAALRGKPSIVAARLFVANGRPLADYVRSDSVQGLPERPLAGQSRTEGTDSVLLQDIFMDDVRVGTLYLRSSGEPLRARTRAYVLTVAVALLAATLLAGFLAARIHALLSKPILALTSAARRVSTAKDYSIRVPMTESPELGTLTAAFNTMLQQIEVQDAELRAARSELEARVRERVSELRTSQAQLRAVVEHSTNLFYTLTPGGDITYVSPQSRPMLDCGPDEVPGPWCRWPTDHPANAAGLRSRETALRTGQRQPPYELELCSRTGRRVWVSVDEAPVRDDLGGVQIVGALSDITDRKRAETEKAALEEQLRQAQKMEAIGRLAGGVAHDFNNILSVITGYSEIVMRQVEPALARKVEQIFKASERAAGLTRQLLAFSRRQVLAPKVLDLATVVGEMEKMLRRLIGEDVRLSVAAAQDLGTVRADPGQVEQVVMNLAVNARDAMPQGGTLELSLENVDLAKSTRDVPAGRYVRLSVSDDGCGMETEVLAHMFEPFFTTKEKGKGTGLGLATVYGIVQQSGGAIEVESRPGKGTTFRLYLPRIDEPVEAALRTTDAAPAERAAGTVLVVEDEEPLRLLVESVLAEAGYTVLSAASGAQGLSMAEGYRGPIDAVLTDVVMPGLSGRQVAERLRARRPAIGVIYMSGYTDDVVARHGVLEPDTKLLHKPFKTGALLDQVADCLRARRSEGDEVDGAAAPARSRSV
jgi:PAS domain S-box-containing protein